MNSPRYLNIVLFSSLSNLLLNPFPNKIHLPPRSKIKMATFAYFRQQTLKSPLTHNICMLPTADIDPDLTHNICMFSTMEFLLTDTYFRQEKLPIFVLAKTYKCSYFLKAGNVKIVRVESRGSDCFRT